MQPSNIYMNEDVFNLTTIEIFVNILNLFYFHIITLSS